MADDEDIQRSLARLHAAVDRAARRIAALHGPRLRCRPGCTDCCDDDLTVFDVEAERIRRGHPGLLARGEPGPPGACAFLDRDGSCRVYDVRPYVCRTHGLPLRWLDEAEDGAPVEMRDICSLNLPGGPPLESLPPERCWSIGAAEARLAGLQAASGAGELRRVALRDLFARKVEDAG